MAALVVFTAPAEARDPHRLKAEKAKKQKAPPPPPGPHLFIVSLKNQRATLYANGKPVARTPISSGTASHPTPTGVFSVIQKNRHHRSNLYSNAPMPFMQRLTWSGIALHQGHLPGYAASHGCIRLPGDFASFLWRTTRLGARVIIAHNDVVPAAISHPKLFQPKPPVDAGEVAANLRRSIGTDVAANILVASTTDSVSSERAEPEADLDSPLTEMSSAAQHDVPDAILVSFFDTLEAKAKKPAPTGPISIFISRKDKRLYVRRGFQALFSIPVHIHNETATLGTHVFTALEKDDGTPGLRWIVTSLSNTGRKTERIVAEPESRIVYRYDYYGRRIPVRSGPRPSAKTYDSALPAPAASDILDRIDLPPEAIARVSEYMTPGATLIVSDHGLSHETSAFTDFIVLTH